MQHLLAAFRTPKIKSLELEIVDHEVLTIVVHSESGAVPSSAHGLHHCAYRSNASFEYSQGLCVGLMKRYQVACVEEEHLSASIDRNDLPTTITADAFQLHKVLNSFQNSLDEVSLVVRPQNPETQGNQHIRMASYNGSGAKFTAVCTVKLAATGSCGSLSSSVQGKPARARFSTQSST